MTASLMARPSRLYDYAPAAAAPAPPLVVRAALVVDHDPATRAAALAALAVFPDAEVKCAATPAEAEQLLRRRHFDVAVVDLDLPDEGGVAVLRRLASPTPGLGARPTVCVASTMRGDDAPDQLRGLLLAAVRGGGPAAPVAPSATPEAAPGPDQAPAPLLSPREVDVLRLVAGGRTVAEMAAALGVSDNTVKAHVKRAYRKLAVRSRAEAARAAARLGLVHDGSV